MHCCSRYRALGLVLAACSLAVVPSAHGQDRPGSSASSSTLRLDARAGIAVPTADMRNYVDEGPVLGAGVSYPLSERVSVRADWTAALMRAANRRPFRERGADVPPRGSDTDLHHLTAGVQVELSTPKTNIEVRGHAGTGVTFLSTEKTELAEGGQFTQFTLDGGLELAVPVSERVRFIGRFELYVLPVRAGAPEHLLKEAILPISAGLAVDL